MQISPKLFLGVAGAMALLASPSVLALPLTVDIYAGVSTSAGGGAPYFGLVGSFDSGDINFQNVFDPYQLAVFGADINGCIHVEKDGDYSFTLDSDDGSLLFIDGNLAVDNSGAHSPASTTSTVPLTAGDHPIEVQYYEAFGYPAELILTLPAGVSYIDCPVAGTPNSVPEPSTYAAGLAVAAMGLTVWRRRLVKR
jgi:hypothetical protein